MKDQNRPHKCFPSARLNSIATHTRYSELSLFAILVLSVLLSGCSGLLGKKVAPMASADDALTFEELVGKNWEEMYIFLGVPGPELLAQIPEKIRTTMPNDERNIWLVNINADDKQDILLYYPSTTESHRVTLLITK